MTDGCRIGIALGTLAALLAAGCGGGGGGSSSTTAGIDRGGITIAQGPISGFGSVIVNGVHYSTSGATITIDGQPGTESDLEAGQVIRVEAALDASGTAGVAKKIVFDDDVEGPVQAIDLAGSRLVVLGQTVQASAATSFGDSIVPRGLEGLRPGDRVEVSGFASAGGVIAATRIERKSAVGGFEVKGVATQVDTAARRLLVNQLQIDYSSAQLSGFTGGQPANGDLLEANGALNGSGVLVATRLDRRSSSLPGTASDKAELEGLVTRFASTADFDVAGQRVTATASTQYDGGTAASIALDAALEVTGAFDASGRIVAQRIEFRRESDLELSGRVDSVNAAASTLTVLGQTVRTTAQTRFEDKSSAGLQRFSLVDVRVGDSVEVRGYREGGSFVASLLEREDTAGGAGGGSVEVKGPATAVAAPNLTVAGVLVTTDSSTEFRDNNGGSITAAAFFAAAPGSEVKVRGSLVGNTVLAQRAELDD
jgi:hypothetical protein